MSQERKPGQPGTLYLIPCPIAEDTPVWDVLPAANRAVIDSLDYFIVENVRSARRFLSKAGFGRPIDSLEFRELNEQGKTIIIVTHDPAVAEACSRVVQIEDGRIVEEV